ncbi:MAG: ATP-grasp fold amidoligase family protein, partial [bacterium]
YVAETIGAEHLIPLLGVWDRPEEIDFGALPERFVLKCNHDSGSVLLCPDKASFDREKARRALKKALSRDYYWKTREYNYKGISRKILAEKLLKNEDGSELTDYKFYCFHGEPRIVQVDLARYSHHVKNYYSPEWDYIPVSRGGEKSDPAHRVEKPEKLGEMLALCRKLSAGLPHVRVDLYCAEGGIYFSELTFHSGGGYNRMEPASYDALWGSYLELKDCDS